MEALKVVLIANRGEIAVRIIKTAKELHVKAISIYTNADAASLHVSAADEAVLLSGPDSKAYLDGEQIIQIAKSKDVDAIIPGYGFLSENTGFAQMVVNAGMVFVGPSPDCIESFGIKHTARELAVKAGVPVVPGTKGLVETMDDAVREAKTLGFPVMLKATAGGGGMGLLTCQSEVEVRESFTTVQSRGKTLFKNAGMFIERYYPSSHHVEVQVFGNGNGKAIHFGERECSIQRRHQKVIEECPSPFVTRHSGLRQKLTAAAVNLAESIHYGSAGTVEFLVDDETADFFFLEMNTRLQVEHGVTELVYDVDLVALMLEQANAQLLGKEGIELSRLESLQPSSPRKAAIEVRLYAENPAKNYAPSPGTLQLVQWGEGDRSRIDTWVHTGSKVTSHYDPLLAKVMYYGDTREVAVEGLIKMLSESRICGPPTNLEFLSAVLADSDFKAGNTMTKFLDVFKFSPPAIDIIAGGAYTLIEDWPGRPTIGKGFSHAGPMDPLALRIANFMVGNPEGKEGLEITLSGPDMRFLGHAIIALCGAPMEARLDGEPVPMWTRVTVKASQRLTIGKTTGGGCRAYLAVYGGFPSIAEWFESKATAPMTAVGGYQGRSLASGDLLALTPNPPTVSGDLQLPDHLVPKYSTHWDLYVMVGPYDDGYLRPDDIEMLYDTTWTISHNAARGGIRLIGPKPKWARSDGGEGGGHPSNVIEYGYPIGTLNWTGDDPCLFPVDCPDLGGFVSSTTIVKADWWRLGQMKAGNTLRFRRIGLADALEKRREIERFVSRIGDCCKGKENFSEVNPLKYEAILPSTRNDCYGYAVIQQIMEKEGQPLVSYRQGGDDFILVDYGHGKFNLNYRCRAVALNKALHETTGDISFANGTLINTMPCGNSLMLNFDGLCVSRSDILALLTDIESSFGDLSHAKFPSRLFRLPLTFTHPAQTASITRYIETQRRYASYLPDPAKFVAENNAFSEQQFRDIYLQAKFMIVAVGFFCALPLCLPVDPRQRMNCPKMNPSRVFTPEGQLSWGGSCMALYNVESPGGYMPTGMTIPGVDILGSKEGFNAKRPWLYEDFDQLTFYEVSEEEYEQEMAVFRSGRYEFQYDEVEFDLEEHNQLLEDTTAEVGRIRSRQRAAQERLDKVEKEMLERWGEEKKKGQVSGDEVEELLNDPSTRAISAPLNANVWKVVVGEKDQIDQKEKTLAILEAMKLEIPVKSEEGDQGMTVQKVLVRPGDVVEAGKPIVLLKAREI